MEHRSALQRKLVSVCLGGIAVALLMGLSGFTPSAATPKITWMPGTVDQTISPGSTYQTTASFTSSQAITNADLSFTPSLQGILAVSPTHFATINPGVAYNIKLAVTVPANSKQQEYNGELMVRLGNAALADSLKLRFRIGTPTPDSFQLIDAALARHEITLDQAALYKVYALFASPNLPSQFRSETLIPDEGTAAFLYALKDWNQLSPATRETIADFITPKHGKVTALGSPQVVRTPSPTLTPGTSLNPIRPATPTRDAKLQPKQAPMGLLPMATTVATLSWERSSESDTINGGSVGAGVTAGLGLATYPQNVWDNGTYTPSYNKSLVPPGTQWASWPQKYTVDVRHFKATFTLPAGLDPATAQGTLYDPYYASDLIPINDNLYVYLNGVLRYRGGTNYAGSVWGTSPYETDGWYIPSGITLNGFQAGTNVIDIVTEERAYWGGLGYLGLRFGPRTTPTPTLTPTPTPTITPNAGGLPGVEVTGCKLNQQVRSQQGNFLIWYTRTGGCAITNDPGNNYPQTLAASFENALTAYRNLGYDLPAHQPYQVYVVPMRLVVVGREVINVPAITFSPEYTFMSNDARTDVVVPAHEFFHAVQWTYQRRCPNFNTMQISWAWYDNEDLRWWMEATAAWAQRQAVQGDRSYIDYIRAYLSRPWQHMDSRPKQGDDGFAYSALFPFYLIERIGAGNRSIIKTTWEQYRDHGNCGAMLPVLQQWVLPQTRKMEQIFPDYVEANYFLRYSNSTPGNNTQVELRGVLPADGQRNLPYRPAGRWEENLDAQRTVVQGPPANFAGKAVDHLGATYVEFHNAFNLPAVGRTLTINANLTTFVRVSPSVSVWAVRQVNPNVPAIDYVPIPSNVQLAKQLGRTYYYVVSATVPNYDSYRWVAMAFADTRISGTSQLTFDYTARVIQPTPTPTSTPSLTPTPTRTATPGP